MEKGMIFTLDSSLLKLLKIYNFVKNRNELIDLAKNVEETQESIIDSEEKSRLLMLDNQIQFEFSKLLSSVTIEKPLVISKTKPIRIYMDGVFDIIHSGHFNAIRQSKKLGDILVVGVNSDFEVEKVKGPTLMNQIERAALVRECKWADEVVEDTPYTPTIELLDQLNCDYCSHGDDMPLNENGDDAYAKMKIAGRMRVFKRTEGISTTDIIGKLLSVAKDNRKRSYSKEMISASDLANEMKNLNADQLNEFQIGPVVSNFLTTSWRLVEFSNNKAPKKGDKVVYIDGAFDILHIGHIETLKAAKALGNFLYVGIHDDNTVSTHRGKNYPIMNLQERVLNILSLRCVDDVIIGAPWMISEDMVKSLRLDVIVEGTQKKSDEYENINKTFSEDPYAVSKKLGIYVQIQSKFDLTNEVLVRRILENRNHYIKKYTNKKAKEDDYYQQKQFVEEC